MPAKPRPPRPLQELARVNPGVKFRLGGSHWKIIWHGRLAGIYPVRPSREGFAENTKSQLRRAGLKIPR